MKRRTYLAAVAGAGTVLAGCSQGSADSDHDVGMTAVAFRPETVEVDVGQTVVWRNTSSRGHTVTAYEDGIPEEAAYFASGGFETEEAAREAWRSGGGGTIWGDETYEHTFEVPGTYQYVCIPHESSEMVGTVEVRE